MRKRTFARVLPTLAEVQAERARRKLSAYVAQAWEVVLPDTPYIPGWHIDAICEHLQAISLGHIHNLIINIPPRFSKSLTVSVFWPTWEWIDRPATQWLTASYAAELAVRDAVESRRLITSTWYQMRWGDKFKLTDDQNRKARYENDHRGHRIAVGVGGGATGEGGDRIIVDDPMKALDQHSDAIRTEANAWWDGTMSTRANNPETAGRVIIMQRLHERDLTGHVLERAREGGLQWEHLCLPMRYEPRTYVSGLGWRDPRTDEGELLAPERFDEEQTRLLEVTLGEAGAASQLQQRPAPAGGAIMKRAWWDGVNRWAPTDNGKVVGRWLSFDTALKDAEQHDYTAWGVWELYADYRLRLRDLGADKLQFPQVASTIEAQAKRWMADGLLMGIVVEDKGSGTSAIQTLRQSAPPEIAAKLIAFAPVGSKEARARQASLWCERGMVLLPMPGDDVPWLLAFEDVLFKFPAVEHDDVVDQMTQIVIYLENYLAAGWQAQVGQTGTLGVEE